MGRRFITVILAASLAVTSFTAAPARAGNEDIVKFLAGATALIIVGKALQAREKDDRNDKVTRRYDHRKDFDRYDRDRRKVHNPRYGRHKQARRGHRGVMPEACRVRVRGTNDRRFTGYGYRCIQKYPRLARSIPGRCVTATRQHRGPRFVYSARCLRRAGYAMR